jgi:hypothetical protein
MKLTDLVGKIISRIEFPGEDESDPKSDVIIRFTDGTVLVIGTSGYITANLNNREIL